MINYLVFCSINTDSITIIPPVTIMSVGISPKIKKVSINPKTGNKNKKAKPFQLDKIYTNRTSSYVQILKL